WGKIVGFGFAFLTHEPGLPGALMHVVWDRTHVVEEFGIDRPFLVFVPDFAADKSCAAFGNGLLQRKALLAGNDIAQPFVRRAIFVGGRGGRSKPALIDAAAVQSESV